MPFKRPIAASGEDPGAEPPDDPEELLAPRHTFTVAFFLSALSFLFFFVVGTRIDIVLGGNKHAFWDLVSGPGGGSGDSLLYIAQVIAAVLGVALTVVAIVVQLAANRYTAKIIDLFLRDPVNVPTLALFVVTVLEGLWVGHVRHSEFNPRIGILLTMGLSTASMLVLLPYFRHIFRFLEPANVVHRIRDEIVREVQRVRSRGTEEACARAQARVLNSLDHLFDIARNSVNTYDRTLATEIIFVFRDTLVRAYAEKNKLPAAWFQIFAGTTTNADFLTFPEVALARFEQERTWLERKVFWQLNIIFQAALSRMRGVCSTISLVVREIGEDALRRGDKAQSRLCVREMNTLIRSGLNGQDIRAIYDLLQQYRMLIEAAIALGDRELAREAFTHFRYYGRLGESMGMGFVMETAAHDLGMLFKAELSRQTSETELSEMLEAILGLAREGESGVLRPATRHGVRRSHVVLAAHLLSRGREDLAARIGRELRDEPPARLVAIRDEIAGAEVEFFELTERVSSFGYVPEEERPFVQSFLESLGVPARASAEPPQPPATPATAA